MVTYKSLKTTTIASKGLERKTYDLKKGEEVTGIDSHTLKYCLIHGIIEKVVTKDKAPENKQADNTDENKGGDDSGSDNENGDGDGEGDGHLQSDIDDDKVYTAAELEAMPMQDVRKVGNKYEVKDNVKDELIAKILAAQEASSSE